MKPRIATVLGLAIAISVSSPLCRSQQRNARPTAAPFTHKVFYYHPRKEPMTPEAMDLVRSQAMASQTIPLWTYSTVAHDGKTYTGSMVGRSPFAHGHRITTIPTYLIPVILTLVGDPLSPGFSTTTNPFFFTNTSTGVTYTLQELAFYSWFLGSNPSLGAGEKYSDNGTFNGYAKACPPGGTN